MKHQRGLFANLPAFTFVELVGMVVSQMFHQVARVSTFEQH